MTRVQLSDAGWEFISCTLVTQRCTGSVPAAKENPAHHHPIRAQGTVDHPTAVVEDPPSGLAQPIVKDPGQFGWQQRAHVVNLSP